ncbi:Flp pilus assembly complex ATPase component TadA [Candidatus Woesearchaeota archaeon]|nr:Flp pilus assembly complex ATPase component TadA [Candidatus Woesearchaeota archaeon]
MSSNECGSYEVNREGEEIIIRINCESCPFFPSIEDNPRVMALVIDILAEAGSATKIVLAQKRDYEYDYTQTLMLLEVAKLYRKLNRQKKAYNLFEKEACRRYVEPRFAEIQDILFNHLKSDPVQAYMLLIRISERENQLIKTKAISTEGIGCLQTYYRMIENTVGELQQSQLIQQSLPFLREYKIGDRIIYRKVFSPSIKPNFMYTKLMAEFPSEGEELDSYTVNDTEVTIFKLPNQVQPLYHIIPPELKLDEDRYEILELARTGLEKFEPKKGEFTDPERIREVFYNISQDSLDHLAQAKGITLRSKELEQLSEILVRYTVGFGLIEVLLQDEKIQDVTINSPLGRNPVFIVHSEFDACSTNIVPTYRESESWASKLRILSGRPLDEANPVLDTELSFPNARARIAAITSPLNPSGIAFALRRHRDKPWTLNLFAQQQKELHNIKRSGAKYMTTLAAGLLGFLVDGSRTMLVAGTRSSGKTSLLGALMTELTRKGRIITIEDSVTGDSEVLIKKAGIIQKVQIGNLIDDIVTDSCWYNLSGHEVAGNKQDIEICCLNKQGKITFSKVTKFIRHKVNKPIYELTTRTGRKIKVTGDHSLFTLDEEAEIKEAKVSELKEKDFLVTPRKIENSNLEKKYLNLFDKICKNQKAYFKGESIKEALKNYEPQIKQLAKEHDFHKSSVQHWNRSKILPAVIIDDLVCLGHKISKENIFFKIGSNSLKWLPVNIELDETLLTLAGLWLADGTYDKCSVLISSTNVEDRKIIHNFAEKYNFNVKLHSDKWTLMLNSKTLKWLMREGLELKGNAYTKRIPSLVYGLSLEQISYVIKGIYSGDGCISNSEILLHLSSRKLLEDIQTLMLNFGIIMRIGKKRKDNTHASSISALISIKSFQKQIGVLQEYKKHKLNILANKFSTHDSTDIIPLKKETKQKLSKIIKNFNSQDYISRNNNIGRTKMTYLLQQTAVENKLLYNLRLLSESDIFFDEIKEIKIIQDYADYVYDVSVPECENFVCNNILAHNTLELPCEALRNLGYNIQQLKVASALTKGTNEVSADEGIRTTLRMGDSSLIVGEIRSTEATALYEAMRVGALANLVAGTIHGDSPYGVFDRVVNDLKVPRTSFKATDIIVIAKPIKTVGGLYREKRVLQITEVRKQWEDDPLREQGFVDLMKYNPKTDQLEPTDELLSGDSEVVKSIAGTVKEWAGNWEAVWDNIKLRTNIKQELINASEKIPEILEAEFSVIANDEFHRITEQIKEEVGYAEPEQVLKEFNKWLQKSIKKYYG